MQIRSPVLRLGQDPRAREAGEDAGGQTSEQHTEVVEEGVEEGDDEEGQGGGADQASHHCATKRGIWRSHHGGVAYRHGEQAEDRRERCHHDRTEAVAAGFENRGGTVHAGCPQTVDHVDEDDGDVDDAAYEDDAAHHVPLDSPLQLASLINKYLLELKIEK